LTREGCKGGQESSTAKRGEKKTKNIEKNSGLTKGEPLFLGGLIDE